MDSVQPIQPFSPGGNAIPLQNFPVQSPLFRAAVVASKNPAQINEVVSNPSKLPSAANTTSGSLEKSRYFEYGTSDIIRLLNQINPNGVDYENLKTYPTDGLTAKDAEILNFLVHDPNFFSKFARLDQNPDTLTTQDILIAAQLAGDSLILSSEDLDYLGNTSPSATIPVGVSSDPALSESDAYTTALSRTGIQQPQDLERNINQVLQKIGADPNAANAAQSTADAEANNARAVSLSTVQNYTPANGLFNTQEVQAYNFLRSQQAQQIMQSIAKPGTQLNAEAVRALVSLAWNPSVYLRSPVIFLPPPESPEALDPLGAIVPIQSQAQTLNTFTRQFVDPSVGFLESIRVSGKQLSEILNRIDSSGEVTLKALRAYVPQNDEEKTILQCLTQHNVFEALSNMDHHEETLSLEDIKIAVSHHMIVLSDAHLSLFFKP